MERIVFIHGSSGGQSTLIPTDNIVTRNICNDIAGKYFEGRILRQKASAIKLGLFVDLYRSSYGDFYCVYSFVNNSCRGAASSEDSKGREGQYFAISVLCKGTYVYPEDIYGMLNAVYAQMFKTGKIITTNKDGEDQYVIPQFEEQKDYLTLFLNKVGDFFDQVSGGVGKRLDSALKVANYDSWGGVKVNLDICNSTETYRQFCETGRIYISEEYESSSKRIKTLEADVQKLIAERTNVESRLAETVRSEKSRVRGEIEDLTKQIQQKEQENQKLKSENDEYKETINTVSHELEKYAKIGKSIAKAQENKTQYQSKSDKGLLRLFLLFLILVVTVLSALMNYAFFRGISPFSKQEIKQELSLGQVMDEKKELSANQETNQGLRTTSLIITPNNLSFEAKGGKNVVEIVSDGEWELPATAATPWISLYRENETRLSVIVQSNDGEERNSTLMLKAGVLEKQIRITQKGKKQAVVTEEKVLDYVIVVTDFDTGRKLKSGDMVTSGQKLKAVIQNPEMKSSGYGWCYSNCKGDKGNKREVTVTVGTDINKQVVFSYGNLENGNLRKKFRLNLQAAVTMDADNTNIEAMEPELVPAAPSDTVDNN